MKNKLESCALATVCVPWNLNGDFLEPIFRRQVQHLRNVDYDNLYIFGTAGEGYAVTNRQFQRIAEVFMEETSDSSGLRQLGVIGLSTAQMRERIEIGLALGFEQFQISLPAWGILNDQELERFFEEVTGTYPEASFLHYNTGRSGRILTGLDYARLLAKHPNLVATKSGGHTVASLLNLPEKAPELCHFMTELDFAAASLCGINCGLLISVSAINPRKSIEFFKAGQQNKDPETLRRMTRELNLIRAKVIAIVNQTGAHMDGAFDKIYARLLDPEFPLQLLSPYQAADEDGFNAFTDWLNETMPDWLDQEKKGNPVSCCRPGPLT